MTTKVCDVKELVTDGAQVPEGWLARAIVNDDNMTYVIANTTHREAIVVDPMKEDWEALLGEVERLKGYRFVAVIDTHTHADHISNAADLAARVGAPLIQHEKSPSRRIHLRVSRDTAIPTQSGPLDIYLTPGHTPDHITPVWGPFVMLGDHILYGDTGRDDLPGGDAAAHFESLEKMKRVLTGEQIFLTGHDGLGGRVSSWRTQLEMNESLKQDRETFVREAGAFRGPSPKILKESLFENFK